MQVSYFETGRYYAPSNRPQQWPMPAGAYDREAGSRAFCGMVERMSRNWGSTGSASPSTIKAGGGQHGLPQKVFRRSG
jgi:hypothetical protein